MFQHTNTRSTLRRLRGLLLLSFVLVVFSIKGLAQSSALNGYTPSGYAPGAPTGAYSLSSFEHVNIYNGNLNFNLPLLGISGRGGAGTTVSLNIENKWLVSHSTPSEYFPETLYSPDNNWWTFGESSYSPGRMHVRQMPLGTYPCGAEWNGSYYESGQYTLTRLTFTAPDGTEYQFHDQLFNGAPRENVCGDQISRGTVFVTDDGTSATFISDAAVLENSWSLSTVYTPHLFGTGYLLLRDGTRYRLDNGLVTWKRDRNGNQINFWYDTYKRVNLITDSLNRQVTIAYDVSDVAPYGTCDRITFQGINGSTNIVRVSKSTLGNTLRSGYTLKTLAQLFPGFNNADSYNLFNPPVYSAVWLPNGQSYKFYYNSYKDLARVVLPSGGALEYDYDWGGEDGTHIDLGGGPVIYRRVVERRTYSASTVEARTTYGVPYSSAGVNYVQVDHTNSSGALLSRERHYFHFPPGASLYTVASGWKEGREWKTELFGADGSTLLRRSLIEWQQRAAVSWWSWWVNRWGANSGLSAASEPANDPRVTETATTLIDTNQVLKTTYAYSPDLHNNQTDVFEYDYGSGTPPTYATRHTRTEFVTTNNGVNYADPVNGSSYAVSDPHLRSLPKAQRVYAVNPANGAETLVAQSETRYDEYPLLNCDGNSCSGAVQWVDPGSRRGNATTSRRWLDTYKAWIENRADYDQLGNMRKTWDARTDKTEAERVTQIEYSAAYHHAYPTRTLSPIPDLTDYHATNTSLVTTRTYDFWTGQVTSTTDPNNKTITLKYVDEQNIPDPLNRLRKVEYPDGGWSSYSYGKSNDAGIIHDYVRTLTAINASQSMATYQFFDGLGRPVRSFVDEGGNPWTYMTTDTQYDAMGRVWRVSNPYHTGGSGDAINPSGVWTTTDFDALGRVRTITTPDAAQVKREYDGARVLVTDQAGRQRLSRTDALGRLTDVWEIKSADAATTAVSFPAHPEVVAGYHNNYAYDVLGHLRKVNQGGQVRYFMYDSLGRLVRAKNPEQVPSAALALQDTFKSPDDSVSNGQWTLGYAYDVNGNLSFKMDARGVSAAYTYDSLNRMLTTNYSDGITPGVNMVYDKTFNGRGRFAWNWTYLNNNAPNSHTAVDEYDAMGRIKVQRQHFWANGAWGQAYPVNRTYDLAGHVNTQTYPSGHVVNYDQFDAAGRLKSFSGNLGDGVTRTYSTDITYDEASRMSREQLGTSTPLYHKKRYNVRGQMWDTRLSTVDDVENWNRGAIQTWYTGQNPTAGESGTDNNGNVLMARTYIPYNDQISSSGYIENRYDYDQLNRISYAVEQPGGSADSGAQTFNYDRWGNRTLDLDASCGGSQTLGSRQFVTVLYQIVLERAPDYGGLRAWNGFLRDGYALGQAEMLARAKITAAGFFHSLEYINRNRSDRDYVRDLYRAYLGREPDQSGWDAWTNVAATQGREIVLNGFANSQEFASRAASVCPSGMTWGVGNVKGFVADAATNRLSAPSAPGLISYDAAGNLTNDNYTGKGTRTYDAENRMISAVSDIYGNSSFYTYDADGNRVRRSTAQGSAFWQVYGIDGELLAEYAANASHSAPQKEYGYRNGELLVTATPTGGAGGGGEVLWLISDQLGTPRMIADKTGSLANIKRHDYLPFGEELSVNIGGRTAAQGYADDSVRQQFTGYERDDDTGLDFAHARYVASSQGRFTSVDPLLASGTAANPRSWNRYAYALNNPLRYTDPSGLSAHRPENFRNAELEHQQRRLPSPPPSTAAPSLPPLPPPQAPVPSMPVVDSGPDPLPPGVKPIPTDIKVNESATKVFNGDPLVTPLGEVLDAGPVYGIGRTLDYTIVDQGGNPMGTETGVTFVEMVTPDNDQAKEFAKAGKIRTSNGERIKTDPNGRVSDAIGLITRDQAEAKSVLSQPLDVQLTQKITISMPNASGRPQAVFRLENKIRVTNTELTRTALPIRPFQR